MKTDFVLFTFCYAVLVSCSSQNNNSSYSKKIDTTEQNEKSKHWIDSLPPVVKNSARADSGRIPFKFITVYQSFRLRKNFHGTDTVKFFEIYNQAEFDSLFEMKSYCDIEKPVPNFDSSRMYCVALVNPTDRDLIYLTGLVRNRDTLNVRFDIDTRPYEIHLQLILWTLPKSIPVKYFKLFSSVDINKQIFNFTVLESDSIY